PTVVGQKMSGGSILLVGKNPPARVDLAKFRDAVFELNVLDHKGAFATTKISGACLGGEQRDLRGKLIAGGLLNVQASIDSAKQSEALAAQR
ncbi:hypothetical protein, partial [Pseudomonas promysalinigenes]|uniref:hypothetical protein n=1 Tax=Pseudomonas promysalinigenes TaxID=485898 RepID=UPI003F9EEBD3